MKIKSKNKFKVNIKKFKKNLNNIHLTLDENNETYRSYGTKTSHWFSSENFLHIKLEENYVTLSLSSFGGMCGFEFDTEEIFKDFKVKNLADIDDLCLMRDIYVLINDCIRCYPINRNCFNFRTISLNNLRFFTHNSWNIFHLRYFWNHLIFARETRL